MVLSGLNTARFLQFWSPYLFLMSCSIIIHDFSCKSFLNHKKCVCILINLRGFDAHAARDHVRQLRCISLSRTPVGSTTALRASVAKMRKTGSTKTRSTVNAGRRVSGRRSQAHTQREEGTVHIARKRGPIGVNLVGLHGL